MGQMKESTQRRVIDVLTIKAGLLWAASLYMAVAWGEAYPRVCDVLAVLAGVTTATTLWVRIDRSRDAWRRGYRTALADTSVGVGDTAKVRHLRG